MKLPLSYKNVVYGYGYEDADVLRDCADVVDSNGLVYVEQVELATAKLIIRSINSYKPLLNALERADRDIHHEYDDGKNFKCPYCPIIAKAEKP